MKNKNNMSVLLLIISIILFILNFLLGWYGDNIYDSIFFIPVILDGLIILLNIIFIKFTLTLRRTNKSKLILIVIIIGIISIVFRFIFPFRNVKTILELYIYEDERLQLIEKVKNNEIEIDENGNVDLPKKLKKLSSSGEITVFQNDENGQVICFWIFRGILSGSHELIYSSNGEKLIKENEIGHPTLRIKKLKDNWYYVKTNY